MRWITREHPRVDRVACPWLIPALFSTRVTEKVAEAPGARPPMVLTRWM